MQPTGNHAAALAPIIDRLNRERRRHEADVAKLLANFNLRELGVVLAAIGGALMHHQGEAGDGSPLHKVDFRAIEDAAEAAIVEAYRLDEAGRSA